MPKRCAAYGCRGNYTGGPYTSVVRFPTEITERNRWIEAMPNDPGSLRERTEIFVCASHFECEWVTVKGGKRPVGPPTNFHGIAKSCQKQSLTYPRPTRKTSAEVRDQLQKEYLDKCDKISSFSIFTDKVKSRYTSFCVKNTSGNLTMFKLDDLGRNVTQFIYFKEVESHFGFLNLFQAEKDGYPMPKSNFKNLQKNSLLHRWSQVDEILDEISSLRIL